MAAEDNYRTVAVEGMPEEVVGNAADVECTGSSTVLEGTVSRTVVVGMLGMMLQGKVDCMLDFVRIVVLRTLVPDLKDRHKDYMHAAEPCSCQDN